MSRRKLRGLTRIGRQVSEDPDLDNLLSNLSPEEMEELQKEVSTVPDPDPSEIIIVEQSDLKQTVPNRRDSVLSKHGELKTGLQRNLSTENEPKRESRKQEYLRKMGLSEERDGSGKQSKEEGRRISMSNEAVSQDNNELKNTNERSRKTKELITKLQEKKVDCREKEGRDESWKRELGDRKTREKITRLQGKFLKEEKSEPKITEIRKRQDSKTRGIGLENKNMAVEQKQEESGRIENTETTEEQLEEVSNAKKKEDIPQEAKKMINPVEKETEKGNENKNEEKQALNPSLSDIKNEIQTPESNIEEKVVNHAAENNTKATSKKDQDEDESSSMFAEDLEKLQNNDPGMTEVNVNNSEVIKVKTLIQFSEALHNNTHVKAFALANCRADDHVAYAIASMLHSNKYITSINMDSNLLTSKGIMALVQALQYNTSLTELRFHNQRHICGGKTEMEMTKILKENTTLLKLGYHFELAGPRMTMTNILSRNMDRQRQKRLQEQKQATAQGTEDKKDSLKVPLSGIKKGSPKNSPKPSPAPSPVPSPKMTPKVFGVPRAPPPPPPGGIPPPPLILDSEFLKNNLTPMSQRKPEDRTGGRGGGPNSRDQLLASIRGTNIKQLKKVALPKLLQ